MKKVTVFIIVACIGLASINLIPRFLHATPDNMTIQEAIAEGTRLGTEIIATRHADSWLDTFMWRFQQQPQNIQVIIKAHAAQIIGEHFLKESKSSATSTGENKESANGKTMPMEIG